MARAHLAEISGEPVSPAGNFIEATQDCGAFVQLSGVLKRVAVKLSKTCNDLRLTSSDQPPAGTGRWPQPAHICDGDAPSFGGAGAWCGVRESGIP